MFSPHAGRFAEYTQEMMEHLRSTKNFSINIPELDISNLEFNASSLDHSYSQRCHPITNTANHYCAFDRFHQKNSSSEKEQLRRLDLVEQLKGDINSQVVEELFTSLDRSIYFLTQCKPVNHIFIIRLVLHLLNEKKNEERLQRITKKVKANFSDCAITYGPDKRLKISSVQANSASLDGKEHINHFKVNI